MGKAFFMETYKGSSLLHSAAIKHNGQKQGEVIGYSPSWSEIRAGSQNRILEPGTEAETMEENCIY